jgi:general secretion pathway protein L
MMSDHVSPKRLGMRESMGAAFERLRTGLSSLFPERYEDWIGGGSGQISVNLAQDVVRVIYIARGETKEVARVTRVDLETSGATPLAPEIREQLARVSDTIVTLPAGAALRRTIRLPAAAAKDLRDILRHEVDRQSPIDPSRVYFDYSIKHRSKTASSLEVELRMIRRDAIEQAIALCRALGLEPVSIDVEGDPFSLNRASLALKRSAVLRAMGRRWVTPTLFVMAFVLLVATLTAAFARNELAASELENRLTDARGKAQAVLALRKEIGELQRRSSFLAEQKQKPLVVGVLSELAQTLPDGSWIYSFQLNGREARIDGFSSSASALIGLFV